MNYYEELGLTPQATPEEIRQAYRNLSRLLHPDQQDNEELRRLADRQMKRLNGVRDILTDPVQRRKYDLSLAAEASAWNPLLPVLSRRSRSAFGFLPRLRFGKRAAALLAALAGGVLLYWHASRPPAPMVALIPPPAPGLRAQVAVPGPDTEPHRSRTRPREARDSVTRPVAPRPPALTDHSPLKGAGLEIPPPLRTAAEIRDSITPLPPGSLPPDPPLHSPFTGVWFYTPPRVPQDDPSLYPPEYIETVILEEDGVLRGRYQARYRVADKAISPEVYFRFEGRPERDAATLPWTGAGGARGEVRLKLLADGAMELDWTALELGSYMGLVSGTAVLIRRQEP